MTRPHTDQVENGIGVTRGGEEERSIDMVRKMV